MIREESLRRRYFATLASQVVRLVTNIASAVIVPRALGPIVYGNYNFLLNAASILRSFLEPSANQAFFTFSSQERESGGLTRLYALVVAMQIGLTFLVIGVCFAYGIADWFWPGQQFDQLILIVLLDWAIFLGLSLQQLGDSKGLTTIPKTVSMMASAFSLLGVLTLIIFDRLDFYTFAAINILSALIVCGVLGYWLLIKNSAWCWAGRIYGHVSDYVRRWWKFAAPLLAWEYYGPIISFMSFYFVQLWYGAAEQGYFALGMRWSSPVLLFTGASLNIIWREVANATANNEPERAKASYLRFNRTLVFIAIVLCVWLSFSSPTLVRVFAGEKYEAAIPVMMIMAFYPLAQTHGQINGVVMKGMGRTREYSNIAFVLSIPDLILTYWLIAPSTAWGLGLGAVGAALRIVVHGLVATQVFEWSNLHFWRESYIKLLGQKASVTFFVALCGLVTLGALNYFLTEQLETHLLVSFILSSTTYFLIIGISGVVFPQFLFGFDVGEILETVGLPKSLILIAKTFFGVWR